MVRHLAIVLTILSISASPAQHRLDSLLSLLPGHPDDDTARAGLLIEIAREYGSSNPGRGLEIADEAIALAVRTGDRSKLAGAHSSKGYNHYVLGEHTAALEEFTRAMAVYQELGDRRGLAKEHHNAGIIHFNMADYSTALEFQQKARDFALEAEDTTIHGAALNSIGVVYLYMADYPKAQEYFLRSMEVFERLGNKHRVANALTNIGIVQRRTYEYARALDYGYKALDLYEQLGLKPQVANVLGNMGNVYDNMDSTDKALELYGRQRAIDEEIGNKRGIASSIINSGIVYSKLADYPRAIEYLREAIVLYEELGDKNSLAVALLETGTIHREAPEGVLARLGIPPHRRLALALEYQMRAVRLAAEVAAVDREVEAWKEISATYERQGNPSKALAAFKNYVALHDSILNDEKRQELVRQRMQFAFETKEALMKAEHENAQDRAAAEIERQRLERNGIMGGSAILLLGAVVVFALYKKHRDGRQQRKEAEFKAEVAETEMKALRAQLNPHFIFNSLNSVSDFMAKHDVATADYYLTRFAHLMRLILVNSELKEVTLADDLKALELYLELESLRSNRKFTYEIRVDGNIDKENTLIPPLLLQPFVENSIWHGIAHKQGSGRIRVLIARENGMIRCSVEDDGVGRERAAAASTGDRRRSFGVAITRSRIDILNRITDAKATMELVDLAEGTRVELKLPLVVN
jgi:tetratricopeptide (TPR) repeat protein